MKSLEERQTEFQKHLNDAKGMVTFWQAQVHRYEGALATVNSQIEEAAEETKRQALGAELRETLGNEITAYANAASTAGAEPDLPGRAV